MGERSNRVWVVMLVVIVVGLFGGSFYLIHWISSGASSPVPRPATGGSGAGPAMDPGQVDDALIAHIQAGRYEDAYLLTTRAYRASVPLEDFTRAVRQNRYLQTSKLIGCFRVVTWEGSVHLRECILHSAAGQAHATLHYALDEGEWRMTGIVIGGTPAFPGVANRDLDLPAEAGPEPTPTDREDTQ